MSSHSGKKKPSTIMVALGIACLTAVGALVGLVAGFKVWGGWELDEEGLAYALGGALSSAVAVLIISLILVRRNLMGMPLRILAGFCLGAVFASTILYVGADSPFAFEPPGNDVLFCILFEAASCTIGALLFTWWGRRRKRNCELHDNITVEE